MEFDVLKKNIFNKSLAFKSIISFTFLVGTTCLLFFMNCSVNEEPLFIDDDQRFSQSTTTTTNNGFPNPTHTQTTTTQNNDDDDCSDDAPISQLSIVQQVAARTNDLYKTNVAEFTQKVAECLTKVSPNWGRRLDDVGSLANDTVAYFQEDDTSPYSVDIVDSSTSSNPQLVWNVQGADDQCGQVGGTWQGVSSDCVLNQTELEEQQEQCTQQQLRNDYATINGQCLRKCDSFEDTNVQGVTIGKGEQCNDTANYNILAIRNTFEEQLDEPQKCCRISSKRSCSGGDYRFIDGNCEPTCAHAVSLAGFTEHHVYSNGGGGIGTNTSDCPDNNHGGHTDWQDFDFYDPYRFVQINNAYNKEHVYEVQPNTEKYGCCRRGEQTGTAAQSYDTKGWHPDDYTLD